MGAKVNTKKVNPKKKQERYTNPSNIQDESLKAAWDKKKTLKQNLAAVDVKTMFEDRFPDKIPEQARHIPKVNEDEAPVCEKLAKKHGKNWAAMHMDIKINEMQWTAAVCKKKVTAWRERKQRSMQAEILSGHGMDFRKSLFGKAKERNVFGH